MKNQACNSQVALIGDDPDFGRQLATWLTDWGFVISHAAHFDVGRDLLFDLVDRSRLPAAIVFHAAGLATGEEWERAGIHVTAELHTQANIVLVSSSVDDLVSCRLQSRGITVLAHPPRPPQAVLLAVQAETAPTKLANRVASICRAYRLTSRETAALSYLVEGLSAKEVAARLDVSALTAQDHIKAIRQKMGCNSRAEVMAVAFGTRVLPRDR